MPDDSSQIAIPPSFVALFIEPGRSKPGASRDTIGERYEFCEDLATLLVDQAQTQLWTLKVEQAQVLARIHQGLLTDGSGVSAAEAWWVSTRLAELLGWAVNLPGPQGPLVSDNAR